MSRHCGEPPRLTGLTREEVTALLATWGEKPYRAGQLWGWLHGRLADRFEAMSDLSRGLREQLAAAFPIPWRPELVTERVALDGTRKWLLGLHDGSRIETVYIPDQERGTLCLSTQVGCSLSCTFCHTGQQGLTRNLAAAEVVEQVLFARARLGAEGAGRVTNLVLMGMGEPLYNFAAVVQAVRILMDPHGSAFGTRKITLSTSGVAPRMIPAGMALGVNLAVSLHAVRDAVRDQLVPLNRKYNLAALRKVAVDYPLKTGRRIFWEYVLLDGVNDRPEDARELVVFLRGIPSKVNLIPFNPWPGSPHRRSLPEATARFQEILWQAGLVAIVRESRGEEIAAACGQLTAA